MTIEGCSKGASSKFLGEDQGSILGKQLGEVFLDVKRIQTNGKIDGDALSSVFPLCSRRDTTTYSATLTRQGGSMILDLREQIEKADIIPLTVPLWDAVESLFAANDIPTLLQLASATMRRMARYERSAVYTIGTCPTALSIMSSIEYRGSAEHRAQTLKIGNNLELCCVAESKAHIRVKDSSHPIHNSTGMLLRMFNSAGASRGKEGVSCHMVH
jgi:hypothetical protein